MPRVSIILRTKNRPRMLARALDDVLAQSYVDWQLVIVNDGGAPADIADVLAPREAALAGRVDIVTNPASVGGPGASNRGLEAAEGDYVVIHDDDDLWHANFLKRTAEHLDQTPDAVAAVVPTEIVIEKMEGDQFIEVSRRPFGPPRDVVGLFDLILINRVVPISMLVRRSVVTDLGGWDESLPVVDDWEFHIRLASFGRIDFLPGEPMAFWMHRPSVTDGPEANSMFASTDAHYKFDRLVRERALRPGGPHHEIGQLLFLSKFIDEQVRNAENRTVNRLTRQLNAVRDELKTEIAQRSVGATVRRRARRIMRRSAD